MLRLTRHLTKTPSISKKPRYTKNWLHKKTETNEGTEGNKQKKSYYQNLQKILKQNASRTWKTLELKNITTGKKNNSLERLEDKVKIIKNTGEREKKN